MLEIAVGTGKNFAYYPKDARITAIDLSSGMLAVAKRRAEKLGLHIDLKVSDAEKLPFKDQAFDTVLSTLSLCTFPDPIKALKEMKRVCKPGGQLLFLEHGKSSFGPIVVFQRRFATPYANKTGCHWDREPDQLIRQSGLRIVHYERSFFGIFYLIKAKNT